MIRIGNKPLSRSCDSSPHNERENPPFFFNRRSSLDGVTNIANRIFHQSGSPIEIDIFGDELSYQDSEQIGSYLTSTPVATIFFPRDSRSPVFERTPLRGYSLPGHNSSSMVEIPHENPHEHCRSNNSLMAIDEECDYFSELDSTNSLDADELLPPDESDIFPEGPISFTTLVALSSLNFNQIQRLSQSQENSTDLIDFSFTDYGRDLNELANVDETLDQIVQSWKRIARSGLKKDWDLAFLKDLNRTQKEIICIWLLRLSTTEDFHNSTTFIELAHIVCSILETLRVNNKFCELFFAQITNDFSDCEDRAAQSLNETYTSWRLHTIDKNASLKDKLTILSGLAKTGELRDTIKKTIQKKNENYVEQVEVVLYFETILHIPLGLVSAVSHRYYTPPKETLEWFNLNMLIETVNNNYKTVMVRSSDFQELAMQDEVYASQIKNISAPYDDEMLKVFLNIDSTTQSMNEKQKKEKMDALMGAKQKALDAYAIEWADRQMDGI